MTQILPQRPKTFVGKDFYKLKNNSNFGYDCRNNINNCTFVLISEELYEFFYLKKYQSPVDTSTFRLVSCKLLEQEIESSFNNQITKLNLEDEYFDVKKKFARNQKSKGTRCNKFDEN